MSALQTDQSSRATDSAQSARAALLARLDQLCRKPVRPPKSLQPTPEAAKSKIKRLRRKQKLLLLRSRQGEGRA